SFDGPRPGTRCPTQPGTGQLEPRRPSLVGDHHRTRQPLDPRSHLAPVRGQPPLEQLSRPARSARTPPPSGRAHPTRHSYDSQPLGPPTSSGITYKHPFLPGNPRSQRARPTARRVLPRSTPPRRSRAEPRERFGLSPSSRPTDAANRSTSSN